jgi:signal transduction histidine kinase
MAGLTCNSDHREWSENSANVILRLVSIPPTSCGALRMIARYFLLGADPAPYDVGEGRDPLQEKDGTRIGSLVKLPLRRDGEGAPLEAAGAATSDKESGAADLDHIRVPAETPPQRDGEFLANVSHELRTPLHAVMGMAEALSDATLSLEQRTSVRLLLTSVGCLLSAMDNLLEFSLLEAGQVALTRDAFDLEQLVDELFRTLEVPARQRGLRLRSEIRQDVPLRLQGDAFRLRQVLTNLVANAIKFTDTGQITMTVSMTTRSPGGLTLHFVVSDTGIGIPKDWQSAVFQPFVQVDGSATRAHGGTGLGLRIATQLVELMGGTIWVESAMQPISLHGEVRAGKARRGVESAPGMFGSVGTASSPHYTSGGRQLHQPGGDGPHSGRSRLPCARGRKRALGSGNPGALGGRFGSDGHSDA